MSDDTNNTNTKKHQQHGTNQRAKKNIQPIQKWKKKNYNIIEKDNTKLADIIYAWG